MRHLAVWALTLTGCASVHGPLDVISPDELTVGHGKTTGLMNGGYAGHSSMFEYEGESDSTYVALTWDIPSFKADPMSREEREAIREENMAAEEAVKPGGFTLVEGATAPPAWLPYVLVGIAVVIILGFALFARRKEQW